MVTISKIIILISLLLSIIMPASGGSLNPSATSKDTDFENSESDRYFAQSLLDLDDSMLSQILDMEAKSNLDYELKNTMNILQITRQEMSSILAFATYKVEIIPLTAEEEASNSYDPDKDIRIGITISFPNISEELKAQGNSATTQQILEVLNNQINNMNAKYYEYTSTFTLHQSFRGEDWTVRDDKYGFGIIYKILCSVYKVPFLPAPDQLVNDYMDAIIDGNMEVANTYVKPFSDCDYRIDFFQVSNKNNNNLFILGLLEGYEYNVTDISSSLDSDTTIAQITVTGHNLRTVFEKMIENNDRVVQIIKPILLDDMTSGNTFKSMALYEPYIQYLKSLIAHEQSPSISYQLDLELRPDYDKGQWLVQNAKIVEPIYDFSFTDFAFDPQLLQLVSKAAQQLIDEGQVSADEAQSDGWFK